MRITGGFLAIALLGLAGCADLQARMRSMFGSHHGSATTARASQHPTGASVTGTTGSGTAGGGQTGSGPGSGGSAGAPPLLSLQMSSDDERRLRDDTQKKLDETERLLRPLETRPLQPRDRETLLLAQGFLDQARKALVAGEYERAANLTGKARTLVDDLAGK